MDIHYLDEEEMRQFDEESSDDELGEGEEEGDFVMEGTNLFQFTYYKQINRSYNQH